MKEYKMNMFFTYGGTQPLVHSNGYGNDDCQLQVLHERLNGAWYSSYTLFWIDQDGDDVGEEEISQEKAKALFWAELQREMETDSFSMPEPITTQVAELNICVCTSRDLANFGCKCGQIQRERARK